MRSHEQYLKAMQMLESPESYPGLTERPHARTLLRIWRYPSFEPYSSWALIEARSQVFLRRVTWDKSELLAITPDTFGCEAPVEAQAYEGLLARLREIQLPSFISEVRLGIDGVTYGVEVAAFGLSARFSWWNTPPPQWAALESWHSEAIETFDGLLPVSTPSIDRD